MMIIGNGPSVRISDLQTMSHLPCVAANRFHLSYSEHQLRPKATFCIDPQVIDCHITEIKASCDSPLYIPRQFFLRAAKQLGLGALGVNYFPFDRGDKPLRFSHHFKAYSGNGASVIYSAIQYAVSAGVTDIYLYGMDHHFEISQLDDKGMAIDRGEQNHFIKNYRQKAVKWFPPDISRIEEAFSLARRETERIGVKIWNASRGGKLEIFDRIDFDDAVERLARACVS